MDELVEFAKIHSPTPVLMNEVATKEKFGYISKGISKTFKPPPLLRRIIYDQLKITYNLNKQFGEAILALEE